MNSSVLVAGTGRMGRDIGLHFLSKGYTVCWLTRDTGRREEFTARLARDVRRLAKGFPGVNTEGRTSVALYDDRWPFEPAALVEAVIETRDAKTAVLARLIPRLPDEALVLSSASSLLPEELHPRAVVTHFFSPLEVAGFVEVVWPADCPTTRKARVLELIGSLGLEALEQTASSAFAATRLLLPLQNECFRAMEAGVSQSDIEEASRSRLFPMGQVTFTDRVGSETVLHSVRNYLSRMPAAEASEYGPLEKGLRDWSANTPGDEEKRLSPQEKEALRRRLLCALVNACYRLIDCGQLDHRGLDLILNGFFWAEASLPKILKEEGLGQVMSCLQESHLATGLSYFVPTPSLGAATT